MRLLTFMGLPALACMITMSGCQREDAPETPKASASRPSASAPAPHGAEKPTTTTATEAPQTLPDDQSDDLSSMANDKGAKAPSNEASSQSGTFEGTE